MGHDEAAAARGGGVLRLPAPAQRSRRLSGPALPAGYALAIETPGIDDYLRLRADAGLSPRSRAAAQAGLPRTVVGVVIRYDGWAVAMARAIGDGLFYQIVDIAVLPEHQRRGLGDAVMAALIGELAAIAPGEAYVSLIADGEAHRLYVRHGFAATAPASIGMARWLGDRPGQQP